MFKHFSVLLFFKLEMFREHDDGIDCFETATWSVAHSHEVSQLCELTSAVFH